MIGLGTWKMFEGSAYDAVNNAIEIGYRHIDCAWIYLNEADIGRAFSRCFREELVTRDDLFVTSKLWNDKHRPEHVAEALKGSLSDLQLDYVDMYLIHWPVAHKLGIARPETGADFETLQDVPLAETWSALAECQSAGLCRNIGVSNFSQSKIDDLVNQTGVRPSCLQVESHPFLQQKSLLEYCHANEIVFVAYSPLGSGDRPDGMKADDEPNLFQCDVLNDIGAARGLSAAQVMLAWAVCRGSIPIPKSASPQRQKQNLDAASIELTEDEMAAIQALDRNYRFVDGSFWEFEHGPYSADMIWA